jgi:hypothetical protein
MCAGQINRERGSQRFGTGMQVLDGLTDAGDGRRRAMLAGFQIGRQLGTGPTEAEHHLEQWLGLRHAHTGLAAGQRRRCTHLGKQIEQLTPIDGHIREHFVAAPRERVGTGRHPRALTIGGDDFAQRFGHMELDMPEFLLTPRGDLPLALIKPLRIPSGLRVE